MKILTCTTPGHFEYSIGEKPILKRDRAIIKIKRIGICGTDLHAFEGTQPFFNYPRILGHELAGELVDLDNAFQYMAHGARYVLVGLQKGEICFSHPEFHKQEVTLMSSRNATREDFEQVIGSMQSKKIDPTTYITHRVLFDQVKIEFESWLDPSNGVIKVMVELNQDIK